jgi:hypothetical protein
MAKLRVTAKAEKTTVAVFALKVGGVKDIAGE